MSIPIVLEKNSRQIPKSERFLQQKDYYDLLYAYFQEISYRKEDGNRYFDKKIVNFVKLAERYKISRQSASKYFNFLLENHAIVPIDKHGCILDENYRKSDIKEYMLVVLERADAALIPLETLRKLNNVFSRNVISVYAVLLQQYYKRQSKFRVSNSYFKTILGMTNNTKGNDYIITDILGVLQKTGLVKFEFQEENGKSIRYVTQVYNKVQW